MNSKSRMLFALVAMCAAPLAWAQGFNMDPQLPESAAQISPHVYLVTGFPNVGIVVGSKGTLVIDTGLGPKNGALMAKLAGDLARRAGGAPQLYLTTTHFHPEHAGGEGGFPQGTIILRPRVQQQELDKDGRNFVAMFAKMERFAPYLQDVTFRTADVLFDRDHHLDLGDVQVQLMWRGAAHTLGDEQIWVETDRALFTGDLAMKDIKPQRTAQGVTWADWIRILDELAALKPRHVLPDHGATGDASLIEEQRRYLGEWVRAGGPPKN